MLQHSVKSMMGSTHSTSIHTELHIQKYTFIRASNRCIPLGAGRLASSMVGQTLAPIACISYSLATEDECEQKERLSTKIKLLIQATKTFFCPNNILSVVSWLIWVVFNFK